MLLVVHGWCAGPPLTPQQIQAAINEGVKYRTAEKVFDCIDQKHSSCEANLKGRRITIQGSWAAPSNSRWKKFGRFAADGIRKDAVFFNDWQAIVAQAAAANHQVRELKPADVQSKGLLHVFVEMQAKGGTVAELVRYNEHCHFVLRIGDRVVQPVDKNANFRDGQSTEVFLVEHTSRQANPVGSPRITVSYSFDVSPQDLLSPVEMILVDADGNRITHEADLAGILDIN
jgi:hypothetical protein